MTRPSRCRRAARDDRVYVNPGSIPEAFAFAYLGAKDGPIAYKKFRSTLCLDEEQIPRSRNTIWWLNKLQVDSTDLATPAGRAAYRNSSSPCASILCTSSLSVVMSLTSMKTSTSAHPPFEAWALPISCPCSGW